MNYYFTILKHHITIDGEKNVLIATGGNSSYAVWVASSNNLDLKLYHATKYILLAEVNIKQCVHQKLTGFYFLAHKFNLIFQKLR